MPWKRQVLENMNVLDFYVPTQQPLEMDVRLISFETHQHYKWWMKKHQWSKARTFPKSCCRFQRSSNCTGPQTMDIKKGTIPQIHHPFAFFDRPPNGSHLMIPAVFFWFPSFYAFEKPRWKWATSPRWRGCCSRVYFAHASDGCSKRRPPSKGEFDLVADWNVGWRSSHFCGITNGSAFG